VRGVAQRSRALRHVRTAWAVGLASAAALRGCCRPARALPHPALRPGRG